MKKFVVVAYDIEDDHRRREAAKILKSVGGERVNKSVFECFLSDRQLERLKPKIAKQIKEGDAVLYYYLCKSCMERIERYGVAGLSVDIVRVF